MTVKTPKTSATTNDAKKREDPKAAEADNPMTSQTKQAAKGPVVPNVAIKGVTGDGIAGPPATATPPDPKPAIDSTLVGQPQGTARAPAERKDQPVTSSPETSAPKSTSSASAASPFAQPPAAAEAKPQAPTQVVEVRKAGFLPMVLGGVIAAGIGAGATYWAIPQLPPAWQPALPTSESADPQAQLDAARETATEAAKAEVQSARTEIIDSATQAANKIATEAGYSAGAEAAQSVLAEAAQSGEAAPTGESTDAEAAQTADDGPELAKLSAAMQEQQQRIDALDQAIAALGTTPAPATSDAADSAANTAPDQGQNKATDEVAPDATTAGPAALASTAGDLATTATAQTVQTLQAELSRLREQVQRHDSRLSELSAQPEIDPAVLQELQSLGQNVASLQEKVQQAASEAEQRIEQARSEASLVQQETQDIMRRTSVMAAAAGLQAALESGGSLQGGLADLKEAGVTLPEALSGEIPSLPYLQREFDEAARAGLRASLRAESDSEDALGAIGNFLRVQTGARSVQPKDGDDPDAILSRAAAKVRSGDLLAALQEVQTLPAAGQDAMSGWTTDAARWVAARAAVSDLSNSVK